MNAEPVHEYNTFSADLRRTALRVLSLRGATGAADLGEALEAISEDDPEPLLEALVERGDVWRWMTDGRAFYAAMPQRTATMAGQTIEVGVETSDGVFECLSDDPRDVLTHLLGPPDWRVLAQGKVSTLEDFAFIAEGAQGEAWRAIAERGAEACRIARLPAVPPRQLLVLRHLAEGLNETALARLDAALPLWAGFGSLDRKIDPAQDDVVSRGARERVVVVAGPGAGKTHTIRSRLDSLLARGVPAPGIVVISYSRTAVAELRERLGDLEDASSLEVATLDSLAGRFVAAAQEGTDFESHDSTVRKAIRLLEEDNRMAGSWLDELCHVVLDEAQDILGIRRELVLAIMARLPKSCGVTVFCDPAQSIHGYDTRHGGRGLSGDMIDKILAEQTGFSRRTLSRNYRTARSSLLSFAQDGRTILEDASSGEDALERIRALLRERSDGAPPPPHGSVSSPSLSLFRWRSEAAWHAVRMLDDGLPVSLDGLLPAAKTPALAPAWVGRAIICVNGYGSGALPQACAALADDPHAPGEEELRTVLAGAMHQGRYDVARMARVIDRGDCPAGPGSPGLMRVSTIHASKGSEADDVAVYLPRERDLAGFQIDPMEEARVLYVAGTRARHRLYVCGTSGAMVREGRHYWRRQGRAVQVLITSADAPGTRVLPETELGVMIRPVLRWSREMRLWLLHAENATGEEIPVAVLPEHLARDVSAIFHKAFDGRPFVPVARGNLRVEPLTMACDETVRVVPVLEGFVWINCAGN